MESIEDRFWRHVQKSDTGCWLWLRRHDKHGYGHFTISKNGRKCVRQAHRVAWILTNGPIPAGLCVLHICDNPTCVRPDHLKLGTKADNAAEMMSKGRWEGNQFVDKFGKPRR